MREPYGYKEFKIKDLFKLIPTSHYGNLKDFEIEDGTGEGTTPFVTTTVSNNGVKAYSKLEPNNEGNTITYSDTTTSEAIFYRPEPFIGRSHVQRMDPKFGLNREIAIYIITCIKRSAEGLYDYSHKFNRKRMGNTVITLPITPEGTPDYVYMEDYIDHIKGEYVERLEESHREEYHQLEALGLDEGAIELEEPYGYEEFELDKFFTVESGKSDRGYRSKGRYPLISATREENGIIGYVDEPVNEIHEREITMANRGSSGVTFLQIGEFAHTNTAFVIKKKEEYTTNQLLYFVGVLNRLDYEGYTKYPTMTSLRKDKLLLPITEEGTPDYDYMENYIKHIAYTYRMNRRDEQEEEIRVLREMV